MRIGPFVFVKELVYKAPDNYIYEEIPSFVKVIDLEENTLNQVKMPKEIYDYCIFRVKNKYNGIGLVNRENNELMGYAFYSDKTSPPTNIPKLPKGAGWLFNTLIITKYRGNGYQKLLISERIKRLRKNQPEIEIYTDIIEENYPSRKSFLNSHFIENGVYYVFVVGIRRYRFLNLKIGFWNKKAKHKKI